MAEPSQTSNPDHRSPAGGLTPSQALGSAKPNKRRGNQNKKAGVEASSKETASKSAAKGNEPSGNDEGTERRNRRRPNKPKAVAPNNGNEEGGTSNLTTAPATATASSAPSQPDGSENNQTKQLNKRRRNRGRGNKVGKQEGNDGSVEEKTSDNGEKGQAPLTNGKQGKKQNKPGSKTKTNKPKKRYPWRRLIPPGTVDPITLENLVSLEYPPFALVADQPYDPIPIWPIPERSVEDAAKDTIKSQEEIDELNRRRIAEQWGKAWPNGEEETGNDTKQPVAIQDPTKRHLNLFDGRALAYYCVSQLQFIDPLNRRDLTRNELLNLDEYLRRHGFDDLNVTDAYDTKGITISSAGAAAATAQGRADIMQQMARNLLNSLFGGHSVSANPSSRREPSLQEQYAAHQLEERQHRSQPRNQFRQHSDSLNPYATPYETGFFVSEDGGLMVIDDDENPGMRGGDYNAPQRAQAAQMGANDSVSNPFYSASHIATRYGSGGSIPSSQDAFPALPRTSAAKAPEVEEDAANNDEDAPAAKQPSKASKTLSRITGAVKKTNPEERQRQWEAREAARKRAMMANMSFGVDASVLNAAQQQLGLLQPPPGINADFPSNEVSEEKLQRNKAFAEALGVQPATLRQTINSGWARPTDTKAILDEFGNELNSTIYPDSLLSQARDRMGLLLKVEKKWKSFLQDDKAASLPLNPMDKPARAFVHHYSDFWNLKTESFDPQPRRYIHCVKMLDTRMPFPLLSDAARKWRGPAAAVAPVSIADLPTRPKASMEDHASLQTAGEPTKSRDIPPPPERVPLPLLPRSLPSGEQRDDSKPPASDTVELSGDTSRFEPLVRDRERPKIELAERTLPLELPPLESRFNTEEERLQRKAREEERARRKQQAEEKKRQALAKAFASDSEEDDSSVGGAESDGSQWDEPEPVYKGSDEE